MLILTMLLLLVVCISNVLVSVTYAECPEGYQVLRAGGSMKDIEIIVKLHNYYRQQIAMGNVTGQPKASNMKRMYWDDDLSETAQAIANTCLYEHIPVTDDRFPIGQNLFTSWNTMYNPGADWPVSVNAWFTEGITYHYGRNEYNHYTQLIWADSILVGCGFSMFKAGDDFPYQKLYVCNYGPAGNAMGKYPYIVGEGCENLCT